jgi:hypothetical protein
MKKEPIVIYLKRGKHIAQNPPKKRRFSNPVHRGGNADGPPADRKLADPDTIQSIWKTTFGQRLKTDDTKGFSLDGRPINLDDLMVETNRARKADGLPQVGKKADWFV